MDFSRDIGLLNTAVCWVAFRFLDGSLKVLRTTFRKDILEGIEIIENALYDLDKLQWFCLDRVKGSKIEIYEQMPELREVDIFANKFIA